MLNGARPTRHCVIRLQTDFKVRSSSETFSGAAKNTNAARLAAAEELRLFLVEGQEAFPDSVHCIVAHSHGGNVALYALRTLSTINARVLTLATPFIHGTPRDVRTHMEILSRSIGVLLFIIFAMLLFTLAGAALSKELGPPLSLACVEIGLCSGEHGRPIGQIGVAVCWGAVMALLAGGLWYLLVGHDRLAARLKGAVCDFMLNRQTDRINELTAMVTSGASIFVAYPIGDEARRALRFVDLVGEFPYGLAKGLAVAVAVLVAAMPVLQFAQPILRLVKHADSVTQTIVIGALSVVIAIPVAFVVFHGPMLLLTAFRLVAYWDDSIFDYLHTRLKVDKLPQVDATHAHACLAKSYKMTRSLRQKVMHSAIYVDQQLLLDAASWLRGNVIADAAVFGGDVEEVSQKKSASAHSEKIASLLHSESLLATFHEPASAALICNLLSEASIPCRLVPQGVGEQSCLDVLIPTEYIEIAEQEIGFVEVIQYFDLDAAYEAAQKVIENRVPCLVSGSSLGLNRLGLFVPTRSVHLAREIVDRQEIEDQMLDDLALKSGPEHED